MGLKDIVYKGLGGLVIFTALSIQTPAKPQSLSDLLIPEVKAKTPPSNIVNLLTQQEVDTDYGVGTAYAEPIPSKNHKGYLEIDVTEYYEKAIPRDDIMPGMKDMSFRDKWIIKSKYLGGNPITFKRGKFSKYYFGKKYGPDIKKIFEEGGVNIDKLTEFLNAHKNEKAVFLYGDGFMILFDDTERMAYILPIGKEVADKVFKL